MSRVLFLYPALLVLFCISRMISFVQVRQDCAARACADCDVLRQDKQKAEEECASLRLRVVNLDGHMQALQTAMLSMGGESASTYNIIILEKTFCSRVFVMLTFVIGDRNMPFAYTEVSLSSLQLSILLGIAWAAPDVMALVCVNN